MQRALPMTWLVWTVPLGCLALILVAIRLRTRIVVHDPHRLVQAVFGDVFMIQVGHNLLVLGTGREPPSVRLKSGVEVHARPPVINYLIDSDGSVLARQSRYVALEGEIRLP